MISDVEGILEHFVRFENAFAEYDNTKIHLVNIQYLNILEQRMEMGR